MIVKDYYLNTPEKLKYPHHPFIASIGYEYRTNTDVEKYLFDCYQNDESICIFQYTISGEGMLEINNKRCKQTVGDVLMIERPGPYRYWISDNSDHWELKFISLTISAIPFWNSITRSFGRTFNISNSKDIISYWDEIFSIVEKKALDQADLNKSAIHIYPSDPFETVFDNSQAAYKFIMLLHAHLSKNGAITDGSESIQLCLEYINTNYEKSIDNLDISNAGFISPYYLNKRFKEVIGETPVQYLTKIRLKNAILLLQDPKNTIDKIAEQCGFQNSNYFSKVFKKHTNISPTEYRLQKSSIFIL